MGKGIRLWGFALSDENGKDVKVEAEWQEVDRDRGFLESYKEFAGDLLKVSFSVVALLGFFLDKVSSAVYFSVPTRVHIASLLVFAAALFVCSGVAALIHRIVGLAAASLAVRSLRRGRVGEQVGSDRDRRMSRRGYRISSLLLGGQEFLPLLVP